MPEQFLHLLDRHSLVDGVRGQRAAELMRMNSMNAGIFAELSEATFDAADADTVTMPFKATNSAGLLSLRDCRYAVR